MNGHDFDDETLMAFADGELDEAAAARVERAIADDEALAARVALFMETRDQARAARLLACARPPMMLARREACAG
jgi:anti-sigma factor RsiW